ncbi:MAG: gliding motility-associated C-terminal domain-containing protein [Saprospiraceae bacterium]|nr:gliding motility-associated C-terminal domain-containing protein [Saprospiraceae bacterium]
MERNTQTFYLAYIGKMLLRFYFFLTICFAFRTASTAQCNFMGNLQIPDEGAIGINILVSNAANNDLNDAGQGVCQVLIKFRHDVVGDLNMYLISPSNQMVHLVGSGGASSGFTDGTLWDISFTPCSALPSPDPGFSPFWDNGEPWQAFNAYLGVYFPFSGCLEDFDAGTVNGTWTLLAEDVVELDEGLIESFTIIFCDETAIECSPCNPPNALLTQDTLQLCMGTSFGSSELIYNYTNPNPDTVNYRSAYVVFDSQHFLGMLSDTMESSLDTGKYTLCLLTYNADDESSLPSNSNLADSTQYVNGLLNNGVCGKVQGCIDVFVLPVSDTIHKEFLLCSGDTLNLYGMQFFNEGSYFVNAQAGQCDTIVNIVIDVISLDPDILKSFDKLTCSVTALDLVLLGLETGKNLMFQWSSPNGNFLDVSKGDTVTINASGLYKARIAYGNCSFSDSIAIESDVDLPEISLSAEEINCSNTTTRVSLTSSSTLEAVNWSGPYPFIVDGSDILVDKAGNYVVTVQDDKGCVATKSILVSENFQEPGLVFTIEPLTCLRDTSSLIVLDSSNLKSIEWLGTNDTETFILTRKWTTAGNYLLLLEGFNGCKDTVAVSLMDESYTVMISVISDTITCAKKTVDLVSETQSQIVSYEWKFPDLTLHAEAIPVVNDSGMYILRVIDVEGCTGQATTFISMDTIAPFLLVTDKVISCDTNSIVLQLENPLAEYTYQWAGPEMFSSDDAAPSVINPGIYTVTVTDESGCTNVAQINVSLSQTLPEVAFSIDSITCTQPSAMIIPLDTSGIDFLWLTDGMLNMPGEAIGVVTNAGRYELQVTNRSNACKRIYRLFVNDVRKIPEFFIQADTLDCNSDSVQILFSSSQPFIEVLWTMASFSSNEVQPFVAQPGEYSVEVKDTSGCIYRDSVAVVLDKPIPDISSEGGVINCDRDSVVLMVNGINLIDPIFEWTKAGLPFGNSQSVTTTIEGVYQVVVENFRGCKDTAYAVVTLDTIKPVLTAFPFLDLNCSNAEIYLEAASTETLVTFDWAGPGIESFIALKAVVFEPGVYTLVVKDEAGCSASLSFNVADSSRYISVIESYRNIQCDSLGFVQLVPNEITDSLIWVSSPFPIANGLLAFETGVPGQYQYQIVNEQGCITLGEIQIEMDTLAPEILDFFEDTITCANASAIIGILPANPNDVVQWAGSPDTTFLREITNAGTYMGTLSSSNGCMRTFNLNVFEDTAPPQFSVMGDTIDCLKSKTDLEVVGLVDFAEINWIGPDMKLYSGPKIKVDKEGRYLVNVTATNGCVRKDSISLTSDFSMPVINLRDTFFLPCGQNSVELFASSPDSLISYKWVGLGTFFLSSDARPRVSMPMKIRLSAASFNGCDAIDSTIVVPDPKRPAFSVTGDTLTCEPGFVTLLAIEVEDDKSFFWKDGAGNIQYTDTLQSMNGGNFTLIVEGQNGCSDSITLVVPVDTLKPAFELYQLAPYQCNQNEVGIQVVPLVNSRPYTFEWTTSDGRISANAASLTPLINLPGHYSFEMKYTENECIHKDTILIKDEGQAIFRYNLSYAGPVCDGEINGFISVTAIEGLYPPYTLSLDGQLTGPDLRVDGLSEGSYQLRLEDSLGCIRDTVVELDRGSFFSVALPGDTLLQLGQTITVPFFTQPADLIWSNLFWKINDLSICDNCPEITVIPTESILISLMVTDSLGCSNSAEMAISVSDVTDIRLPNVFYPGGGGQNSIYFLAEYPSIEEVDFLRIYDNWGNIVFQNEKFSPGTPEDGWNGLFNGQAVNPGVFVAYWQIRLKNGSVVRKIKDITVIR